MSNTRVPNRKELEAELSKALTQLESTVEQSTVSRMNGRTSNNRLVHGEAVWNLLQLFDQYVISYVKEIIGPINGLVACDELHPDAYEGQRALKKAQYAKLNQSNKEPQL